SLELLEDEVSSVLVNALSNHYNGFIVVSLERFFFRFLGSGLLERNKPFVRVVPYLKETHRRTHFVKRSLRFCGRRNLPEPLDMPLVGIRLADLRCILIRSRHLANMEFVCDLGSIDHVVSNVHFVYESIKLSGCHWDCTRFVVRMSL